MRSLKLGALGLLVVITGIMLLWVTDAVPRDDLKDIAPKAIGAVLVLVLASYVWSAMRGEPSGDHTDKPVP
jgi:hypothetical protein